MIGNSTLLSRGRRCLEVVRGAVAEPGEATLKAVDIAAERRERWHHPDIRYQVDEEWERHLHELVGAEWPCPSMARFAELWQETMTLLTSSGRRVGRGAFGGWGDGEPAVTRAAWCLTLHLHPRVVVETGVARGITSRFILEALAANADGHLWSIDLPPWNESLRDEIGLAVPSRLRGRWSYVHGSSRRRLGSVLREVGDVDLFVHDSRHSARNLSFELRNAWQMLRHGGAVIADDIDMSPAFAAFDDDHSDAHAVICRSEPLEPDPDRQDGTGVFGVALKRG